MTGGSQQAALKTIETHTTATAKPGSIAAHEQVAPGLQFWVQSPPAHDSVQVEPLPQFLMQLPPAQVMLHTGTVPQFWTQSPPEQSLILQVAPLQVWMQSPPLTGQIVVHDVV